MADYDAKIRVSADTKQAESELSKLQKRISQLGDAAFKLDARNFQKSVRDIGTAVQGIGQRGALGALTLAAGKATTALGGVGAKFGILGAAAASAGAAVNNALGGVPNVITDILNHIGQVPNAFGIAAVAAMAFAPQILKASSAATGLAAAVDKAVGKQTTQKIASVIDNIGQLNTELNATATTFQDLISGSTLNQLNNQLKDAVKQSGEFHSSTVEAVTAAEQLVAVQKEQRKEQKAINDLIRQAQGLQPQDVRDAELNRRVALLKSREIQQQKDLKLQNQINAELAEYERLAAQVAAQTKLWASNLERIARSSKAGVFGTQSQLRTRVQEFQENRRSADIARQRSAELMARERAMAGGQYSLAQVPARGELFPGGRTETASNQYRSMLNEQARIRAAASDALARSERTVIGLQAQTLKTEQQITAAKRQQQSVDERSIQILRDQNKLLMEQYRAQQRVASGTLDPASLRADRKRRVEQGRTAQARRREMTENVIIGGAFPMLFGGGPGAVLGGAAGGLIPGNPMLSVATSAVGAVIDSFIAKTTELGGALLNVTSTFDTLKERALISNREREKEIQLLQDAGFAATANAVAQEELFKTIGAGGVESLRQLGTESDRLNRTWAELSVQLQAVIAGPLADLAERLNDLFGPKAVAGRVSALREDLTPQRRAQLNKELIALGGPGSARFGAARKGLNEVEIELAARKFPEKVQALLDKYGPMRVGAEIKYDAKQVREQIVNTLQKQLEVIDIAQKFREAGEKQKELDRQRYDLVASYEESIAAIRRRIEDEITSKRLSLIQKENELLDIQAQIRQEGLSVANAQARRAAGEGLPTAARDVARQAAEAAGTFQEQELALAEQAAKLKRDSALEALRTDIQAAKFQADTAREVNKLNIDTAKRVADINASIRKQNASQDTRRFEIEKELALIRLNTIATEFALLAGQTTATPTPQDLNNLKLYAQQGYAFAAAEEEKLKKVKAPTPLKEIGAVGGQGVSFEGIKQLNAQLKEAEANINAAKQAYNDLLQTKNIEEFKTRMQNIAEGIEAPLQALNEDLIANQVTRTRYAELIEEGVRGVVAERIIEIEKLRDAAILQYDAVILELEKKREIGKVNEELERQIKLYKERRDAIEGKAQTAVDTVKKEESPAARLQAAITKAREDLTELTDPINQVVAGAKAIGDAFQQAFKGLVSGAMTGQEALAAFFKGVGDHFLDMASMMIAKLIEIWILETVLGLISGAASGSFQSKSNAAGKATFGGSFKGTGSSTFGSGGIRVPGYAEGGFVTGPTRALIGEGGEPEYVIPQSKMSAAMSRYSRGARGEAVIPGNGGEGGAAGGTAVAAAPIDVRYTVERINSVDYVTADQFRAGMQQAAAQGARQGEQNTLRRLQNAPSARRRLGI